MAQSRGEIDLDTARAFSAGYSMIRKVVAELDPYTVVWDAWAAQERRDAIKKQVIETLPGLMFRPAAPQMLAIEVLAAVMDLVESEPALKPLLRGHLENRAGLFEQWVDELENEEDDEYRL
jgi:hypothetical protein